MNLKTLLEKPDNVVVPRGHLCHENIAASTKIDMNYPVLMNKGRKLGYKFMAAEAWWILTGQNFVHTISPYAPYIKKFSDDQIRFDGAYGPKVVDQLRYVVECLRKDNDTRQAVISIWRDNPRDSSDIPCTLSLQFLIRGGVINTIATMRSSDIWLGWPYDIFNFTMITSYVALAYRLATTHELKLGHLWVRQGSFHLYERNFAEAQKVVEEWVGNLDEQKLLWNPLIYTNPITLISDLETCKDFSVKELIGLS